MSILIRGMEWDGRPHKALFYVKDGEPVVIVETAFCYDDRDIKVYPVEIKPVARGEWKPLDLTFGRSYYYCSSCEMAFDMPTAMGVPMFRYCPNCGAWMVTDCHQLKEGKG